MHLQYGPECGVSAVLYIIFLLLFQERSLSVTACRVEKKNPKWSIITYSPDERKRKGKNSNNNLGSHVLLTLKKGKDLFAFEVA